MYIQRKTFAVGFVVVLCGGYIALGEIGNKLVDASNNDEEVVTIQIAQNPPKTKASSGAVSKPDPKPAKPNEAKPADDPEEKIIREAAEAFAKLYCEHDSKGLAELFAPKAEMIGQEGRVVKGREAIERTFVREFKEHPAASMTIEIESIRVITPLLAIEEGTTRSKDFPEGTEDATVYVAIHVKHDGKWRLACVRDWNAPPKELTIHERLERDLAWLVGEWVDESPESIVHTICKWSDNGNFLLQEFHVNVAGGIAMSGTNRIGWDAVAKQFKSWVFDSKGGHTFGSWSWDGSRWIVKTQGTTADGEVGSATNYYRPIDADTIAWGSYDRVIDGESRENIPEIIMKRRPPAPAE